MTSRQNCYLYFSMLFVSLTHRFLSPKLIAAATGDGLLEWVAKFLNGKNFHLRATEAHLERGMVTIKVPRYLVLLPLLSLIS